jgi:branched-chain amino acid aminotransferase
MKAYKDNKGNIRLFRPDLNMKRFNESCHRLALPGFHGPDMLECIKALLRIDSDWIPEQDGFSLYLRPTCIATSQSLGVQPATRALFFVIACPVGPYFANGFAPIRVLAESNYCRAWPGGTGASKVGSALIVATC